jgi:hypothetical protein
VKRESVTVINPEDVDNGFVNDITLECNYMMSYMKVLAIQEDQCDLMATSYKEQVDTLTTLLVLYEKEYIANSTALINLRDRYLGNVEDYQGTSLNMNTLHDLVKTVNSEREYYDELLSDTNSFII